MRKQVLALVGIVAVTGVAFAAAPEGPRPAEGSRSAHRLERRGDMKKALGLTDAQAAELKKLRAEQQKKQIRQHADLRVAQMELRELFLAPTVDEKAVRAKAKQIADLQAAAATERVEAHLALRKVVSAEQAEKLMCLQDHKRGEMRGPGKMRGHGPKPHRRGPRGADGSPAPGPDAVEREL